MKPDEVLIVMVPRQRRDEVVDALMSRDELGGFSMAKAGGFSREHARLDLREQVQGYRDFERFEVLCTSDIRQSVLEELADLAGHDHFHYWVLPLLTQGTIGGR